MKMTIIVWRNVNKLRTKFQDEISFTSYFDRPARCWPTSVTTQHRLHDKMLLRPDEFVQGVWAAPSDAFNYHEAITVDWSLNSMGHFILTRSITLFLSRLCLLCEAINDQELNHRVKHNSYIKIKMNIKWILISCKNYSQGTGNSNIMVLHCSLTVNCSHHKLSSWLTGLESLLWSWRYCLSVKVTVSFGQEPQVIDILRDIVVKYTIQRNYSYRESMQLT